jgi:hypothetical protein
MNNVPFTRESQLQLEVVSTDNQDQSITVSINGKRYKYQFEDSFPLALETFEAIRKRSQGRALVWIKQHSSKTFKLVGESWVLNKG